MVIFSEVTEKQRVKDRYLALGSENSNYARWRGNGGDGWVLVYLSDRIACML